MPIYPFLSDTTDDVDAVELFRYAVEQGCSDVHIKVGSPPKLRVNGVLAPIPDVAPLTTEQVRWLVAQTQNESIKGKYNYQMYSINYAWDIPPVGRFRINVFRSSRQDSMVARLLVDSPPTFADLNTNPVIVDLMKFRSGLIFVTGATGSGKTTLMAAMIQKINTDRACHIISVEDPIEIVHTDIRASVSQREIGIDVDTFADALKDSLREDPDVILIGEIRDEVTAKAALKAAETGHLVISTLHSTSASSAISRFLEILPYNERDSSRSILSGALRAVISQRLVPNIEKTRTAVNEILLNTREMQKLIERGGTTSEIADLLENSTSDGMQSFEHHLARLYEEELISEKVAIEEATYSERVQELLADLLKNKKISPKDISEVEVAQEIIQAHLDSDDENDAPKTPFTERAEFASEQIRRSTAANPLIKAIRPLPTRPTGPIHF